MSVKERLKSFIKREGLSVKAFEESIGVSNGYVNSISKGIGKRKLETILEKYPKLSLEWLLTGKSPEHFASEPKDDYLKNLLAPTYAICIPKIHKTALAHVFYDKHHMSTLDKEVLPIHDDTVLDADWFKIEVTDMAMNTGSKHALVEGDWAYCKAISKQFWKEGFDTTASKMFCFFHNEHGILFRAIRQQDVASGTLTICALNPDKAKFPDFKIKVSECSFICSVINVLREL